MYAVIKRIEVLQETLQTVLQYFLKLKGHFQNTPMEQHNFFVVIDGKWSDCIVDESNGLFLVHCKM